MALQPLPQKVEELKTDIKNLKAGILELENPTETPLPAAAGSLRETLTATFQAIGSEEEQQRSRMTRLHAMRPLLADAEASLKILESQLKASGALYSSGVIRIEKARQKYNAAVDAMIFLHDEFQAAVNANSDASATMLGTRPYAQNQFNFDERWLQKIGKISPISPRHCYLILQAYEYHRAFPDGE